MFTRTRLKIFSLIALLIIAAFLLHAIEFNHHHMDEFFGSTELALNHSSDKKKWLGFVLGLLFVVGTLFKTALRKILPRDHALLYLFEFNPFQQTLNVVLCALMCGRLQRIHYN